MREVDDHPGLVISQARDHLLNTRSDYAAARAGFIWPRPERFNFALDWIDEIARARDREALRIVNPNGATTSRSYSALAAASNRAANYLSYLGVRRGDPVLVMLDHCEALWEAVLAIMKLGAVLVPATTLLSREEIADRLQRAQIRAVVTATEYADRFEPGPWIKLSVGDPVRGWMKWENWQQADLEYIPDQHTRADDPLLVYFTSGTTAKPKLVVHSHSSYPIGQLSTMYWIGLTPGDIHLNISSPGWAKHAWSSVFAPWLAEATIVALGKGRFDPIHTLDVLVEQRVTTFCAPPTVWRHLTQHDLTRWRPHLREAVAAGEPLNPEVIARVRQAWGIDVRDGYGQTETSALIGNTPGQKLVPGAVGRVLPGFNLAVLNEQDQAVGEGELAISLAGAPPVGLMRGYKDGTTHSFIGGEYFRTGDILSVDEDGLYTYVGRGDDVFKSSDYRISPFELESALIEHPAVLEAAVVPSPDPLRLAVPKAFIAIAPDYLPNAMLAADILAHARSVLAPFKRVRRLQFLELPKTISGKIRRVELRRLEATQRVTGGRAASEWWEEDLSVK